MVMVTVVIMSNGYVSGGGDVNGVDREGSGQLGDDGGDGDGHGHESN